MKNLMNLSFDKNCYNIWRYAGKYAEDIDPAFYLTLTEGWTGELNLSHIANNIGLERLWVKRDDLNPTGSHKDRSLAFQISKYFMEGHNNLLISSSGNAAISAAAYCCLANIRLFAFISPETNRNKIALMKKFGADIIVTSKPINLANYISRVFDIVNLRPSINDVALEGYKSIAFELVEKGIFPDAIFFCPTSASTLVGVGRAYNFLEEKYEIKSPQIHAVQYGDVTSLAEKFIDTTPEIQSPQVHRLGIKHTPREKEALNIINKTNGSGWVVNHDEINQAGILLNKSGITTSMEGTATVAGLLKAVKSHKFKQPLCLFTGHHTQWENAASNDSIEIHKIENYLEAKDKFEKIFSMFAQKHVN
ncbi:pyridoxal-phosphate dependent enzyme [Candidatus Poribacteria bacterium]|nr:pyridoxal-phosphate dependent enzyme [Candidatus Poribacteria bacterium]